MITNNSSNYTKISKSRQVSISCVLKREIKEKYKYDMPILKAE
jgi:hypothetical protein